MFSSTKGFSKQRIKWKSCKNEGTTLITIPTLEMHLDKRSLQEFHSPVIYGFREVLEGSWRPSCFTKSPCKANTTISKEGSATMYSWLWGRSDSKHWQCIQKLPLYFLQKFGCYNTKTFRDGSSLDACGCKYSVYEHQQMHLESLVHILSQNAGKLWF